MTSDTDKNRTPDAPPKAEDAADRRDGRRYSVVPMRGKARSRVRYIEGNAPKGGCRFLD